ncbi:aa_trans domain-containing protein [Trichonephila clavipes]|nr:aa_trans domain-containing protein [Trichonephila clavipes]
MGVFLVILCGINSLCAGNLLGWSWNILQDIWPEYKEGSMIPYAEIGHRAVGLWMRVSRLKVSKSYGLLLRNYAPECNKLFIHGLENSPRFFGSSPIDRTCTHYSAIADDKLFTLTSLVKTWTPQQKAQCALWLTEFKSVTLVRTEWNVDPPISKSIQQWGKL